MQYSKRASEAIVCRRDVPYLHAFLKLGKLIRVCQAHITSASASASVSPHFDGLASSFGGKWDI